jgi:hypothetical protein
MRHAARMEAIMDLRMEAIMDLDVHVLEAIARQRLDDLRHQARVRALPRRRAPRRARLRLGAAVVALGAAVARLGAALVALGHRLVGDALSAARP